MKYLIITALLSSSVFAGDAIVSWDPPTTYEDGSPLAPSEIQSYTVYYGTTPSGPYGFSTSVAGTVTTVTLSGLTAGNWYFVARVKATNGLESANSNEVVKSVVSTSKPKPPKAR